MFPAICQQKNSLKAIGGKGETLFKQFTNMQPPVKIESDLRRDKGAGHLLKGKFLPRFPHANEGFKSDQFGNIDVDANDGYNPCSSDWSGQITVYQLSGSMVIMGKGTSLQCLIQTAYRDRAHTYSADG